MEISGLGNSTIDLNLQQAPIAIPKNSFHQVLRNVVNQGSSNQNTSTKKQNNNGTTTAESLLSFLKKLAALQADEGNAPLKPLISDSDTNLLQLCKNLLGQSNPNQQGILTDLEAILNADGEQLNAQGEEVGSLNANLNGNRLSILEGELLNSSISGKKMDGNTNSNDNLTLLLNKMKSLGTPKDAAADLIYLLENSLHQMKGGSELLSQLESNSKAGSLQASNDLIGNNRNKSYVNAADRLIETILAGLLGQSSSQLNIPPPSSTIKGSALNGSLSKNSRLNEMPNLGSVETVKGQLQENSNLRLKYLESTFSQAVKEISSSKDNGLKTNDSSVRFSDWNNSNSIVFHQMSKPEQFVLMTQGVKNAASVNHMIQQFESILARSQFSKTAGAQQLVINLHPENLGSLRIELVQKDQTTIARILTTTAAAKDALEAHLHSLKDAFAAQNIPINKVEIGTQLTQPQENRFSDNRQQQQPQQQRQQQSKENEKEDDSDSTFILSLDEAILNKKV